MKLDKKPTPRALKSPAISRVTSAATKPAPVAVAKAKRVAKTATEAQPQAAPKAGLTTKVKRPARAISAPVKVASVKATAMKATAMKSKRPAAPKKARQPKLEIPPILLAGDTSPAQSSVSGPGQRYALGPTTPPAHASPRTESGELPETYGTAKLWLAARDPQWLYAHWDLSTAQLRDYNAKSDDGHLIVRVFEREVLGEPLVTQHVHPESRNWFLHVGRGGTKFVAQLGYFDLNERWQTIAVSAATVTPPDNLSDDNSAEFATLPAEVPFEQLVELVKAAVGRHVPLMEALAQLRDQGHPNLPTADTFAPPPPAPKPAAQPKPSREPAQQAVEVAGPAPAPAWTPAQAEALAEVVTMDEVRRVWIGSMEITELVRRQLMKSLSNQTAAQLAAGQGALGLGSPSSPFGALGSLPGPIAGGEKPRGFWFNINAELILYGATEPDAAVSIGGRRIRLRPDGTFSYRFALPDGTFDLPAIATSAAGDDTRAAQLQFRRTTDYRGDVGTHPQDASLKPPTPDSVA